MSVLDNDHKHQNADDVRAYARTLAVSATLSATLAVLGTACAHFHGLTSQFYRLHVQYNSTAHSYALNAPTEVGGPFNVFAAFLGVNYGSALSEAALYALGADSHSDVKYVTTALLEALTALGTHVVLGGVALSGALGATLLALYVAGVPKLSPSTLLAFCLAYLAVVSPRWSASESPFGLQRSVFAFSYALFASASAACRLAHVRADVTVVVQLAGRVTALGQAYGLLNLLGGTASNAASDVFMLSSLLPVTGVVLYVVTASEQTKARATAPQKRAATVLPVTTPQPQMRRTQSDRSAGGGVRLI
jgi:hypothetical protein